VENETGVQNKHPRLSFYGEGGLGGWLASWLSLFLSTVYQVSDSSKRIERFGKKMYWLIGWFAGRRASWVGPLDQLIGRKNDD
jgi:hypothetical protein